MVHVNPYAWENTAMRVQFWVVGIFAITMSAAFGIEFKPYPNQRITEAQWKSYFEEIKSAYGASMQTVSEQRLVVFSDKTNGATYAFTAPGHPAHPAWIARRVVQNGQGIQIEQIGYFAGQEPPFAELFRQYRAPNQTISEQFKRQQAPR